MVETSTLESYSYISSFSSKASSKLFQIIYFWTLFLRFRHFALSQNQIQEIEMISNDNAFLNTMNEAKHPFEQRTLFTRFGSSVEDRILVAKPIFHLWTILSLQGPSRLCRVTQIKVCYFKLL